MMYFERLKHALLTETGLHLVLSSGDTEQSIELSSEAAGQILHALQGVTCQAADEGQLTVTVLGHQIMRTPEAYGLRLRTLELGDVVFSLPQAIVSRLTSDLIHLASSSPAAGTFESEDRQGRGKPGLGHA